MRRFLTLARLTSRASQEQQLELPVPGQYQPAIVRSIHQSSWLCLKSHNQNGSNKSGIGSGSSSPSSFSSSCDLTQGGREDSKSKHNKLGLKQQGSNSSGRIYSGTGGATKGRSLMGRGGTSGGAGRGLGGDKQTPEQVMLDKRNHRFTLDLGNNQIARIDFKSVGPHTIEMYHTEVPAELRNRGLGKVLASGALRQAANNNMKVKLTCSFLVDYVNQNQDPSAHIVEK